MYPRKYFIVPVLVDLYNASISAGRYPVILKTGTIVPIFKKGDTQIIELSTNISYSKLIERILLDKVTSLFR